MSIATYSPCPSDETLALLATGDIDAQQRAAVLAHTETCDDCLAAVRAAVAQVNEERSAWETRSHSRWWMGLAAAAAIATVVTLPLLRNHQPSIAKLVALAPASERLLEPRLAGGFAWAPYRGPARSGDPAPDVERLKIGGVAGEMIERAESDPGADAQHAAGVAMVLVDKPEEAASRLDAAARTSRDARTWNDLAAARYVAATESRRDSGYARALAAADEALRLDPRLAEALFNRALILERMESGEARQAWQRYLDVDAASPWANEARQRLAALTSPASPADRSTRGGTSSN